MNIEIENENGGREVTSGNSAKGCNLQQMYGSSDSSRSFHLSYCAKPETGAAWRDELRHEGRMTLRGMGQITEFAGEGELRRVFRVFRENSMREGRRMVNSSTYSTCLASRCRFRNGFGLLTTSCHFHLPPFSAMLDSTANPKNNFRPQPL